MYKIPATLMPYLPGCLEVLTNPDQAIPVDGFLYLSLSGIIQRLTIQSDEEAGFLAEGHQAKLPAGLVDP